MVSVKLNYVISKEAANWAGKLKKMEGKSSSFPSCSNTYCAEIWKQGVSLHKKKGPNSFSKHIFLFTKTNG